MAPSKYKRSAQSSRPTSDNENINFHLLHILIRSSVTNGSLKVPQGLSPLELGPVYIEKLIQLGGLLRDGLSPEAHRSTRLSWASVEARSDSNERRGGRFLHPFFPPVIERAMASDVTFWGSSGSGKMNKKGLPPQQSSSTAPDPLRCCPRAAPGKQGVPIASLKRCGRTHQKSSLSTL